MVRRILPMLLVLMAFSLAGCGDYGKVEQGRTVKYDKSTTPPTVWIIQDSGIEDRNPQYTVLPAHAFKIPEVAGEMGAEPFAGKRVKLDLVKKEIVMYNEAEKKFDYLPFELVEKHEDVSVRRQHPLVYDSTTGKARPFPVANAAESTLTIYSARQEVLSTIRLSPMDFAKYSGDEWDAGDEVRIYYKEPGKAIRMMNVTKTDITKK
ncbi:DUF4881 domain-containing protein [Desulfosarcina sp. OttesenSCG-928-G10]|nr:DUF4881 domain-containing protein [Desulfosarcina sp. OttesenSCG-928-G10]